MPCLFCKSVIFFLQILRLVLCPLTPSLNLPPLVINVITFKPLTCFLSCVRSLHSHHQATIFSTHPQPLFSLPHKPTEPNFTTLAVHLHLRKLSFGHKRHQAIFRSTLWCLLSCLTTFFIIPPSPPLSTP